MNLITLQEYKSYYGLNKPDNDGKLNQLISSVSALIQTYTGRQYDDGTMVTETISLDYDTDTIFLSHYPVQQITSISETARYTTDSTVHVPLVYESDFILNKADGTLLRQYRVGGFANWPVSPGIITVSYVTGNATDTGTPADVPADLKLAAIMLVNYYEKDQFVQAKSIAGTSQTNTMVQGEDFPKHIQVLLDRYR